MKQRNRKTLLIPHVVCHGLSGRVHASADLRWSCEGRQKHNGRRLDESFVPMLFHFYHIKGTYRDGTKRRKQVRKLKRWCIGFKKNEMKLVEVRIQYHWKTSSNLKPHFCHHGCYRLPAFLHSFPCFSAKNVTLLRVLTEMQALLAAHCLSQCRESDTWHRRETWWHGQENCRSLAFTVSHGSHP